MRDFITIAATALIVGGTMFIAGRWLGSGEGYDRRIAEVAVADGKAEMERRGHDAILQGMSDYDLCRTALSAARMRVDACEQLRGLRAE